VSHATDQPSALVVMAPLREGREAEVLSTLAAMPNGPDSPFARVGSTHFVRWLLVGALLGGDGEPAEPSQSYLLFSADFDGPLEDWGAAVAGAIGADVDRVFEQCDGYPGSRDGRAFLGFLSEHRIEVGFSVISYRATVAAIRESLELRRALREFAVASRELGPSELRRAWKERFGG
jgi:hypothetical protein